MLRWCALLFAWGVCCAATCGEVSAASDVSEVQLYSSGHEALVAGKLEQATELLGRAADESKASGDRPGQIRAMIDLSAAHQSLGRQSEAINVLSEALIAAESGNLRAQVSSIEINLGIAYTFTRNFEAGRQHLERALSLCDTNRDETSKSRVLNNLGILHSARISATADPNPYLSKPAATTRPAADQRDAAGKALRYFDQCVTLAVRDENFPLAAKAAGNAAFAAARVGLGPQAAQWGDRTLDLAAHLPNSPEKSRVLTTVVRTDLLLLKDPGADKPARLMHAYRAAEKAFRIAKECGDARAESDALGYAACLYQADGRFDDALTLTLQAAAAAQRISAADPLYRWQWQAATLLRQKGEIERAVELCTAAVGTVQSIRLDVGTGLSAGDASASFRDEVGALYFETADVLLRQAVHDEGSPRAAQDLKRARDTLELLKEAEVDAYFQERCRPIDKEILPIEPHTAVLYLVPLPDRTELVIDTAGGLRHMTLAVNLKQITAAAHEFRRQLETRTTQRFLYRAHDLYDWIIRPIEEQLRALEIKTLVFVPDGELLNIPFAALHDGENFLVARYSIGVAPGLKRLDRRPTSRVTPVALVGGMSDARGNFPALDFVREEVQSVSASNPSQVLLDRSFEVKGLVNAVRNESFSILHLASHAQFAENASDSFILTYSGKLQPADLRQMLLPYKFREQPLQLLTLSACETAAGDDFRAALGLAGLGIKCGARSSLASLWAANDKASAEFMAAFYSELSSNPSASKADLVRRAQLRLLSNPRYQHPCYWAPYLLIGNWQ